MLKFVKKPEANKIMDRKSSASVKGPKAPVAAAAVARSRKSTASMSREEMMQRVRDEKSNRWWKTVKYNSLAKAYH